MAKRNRNPRREYELAKARRAAAPLPCEVEHCPSIREAAKRVCSRHAMRRRLGIGDCVVWGCVDVPNPRDGGTCRIHTPTPLKWRTCDTCGERYHSRRATKREYCPACRTLGYRRANALYMRERQRSAKLAEPMPILTCRECGMVAPARDMSGERWRSRSVYCSARCMRRSVKREAKARRRQRKAGAGYEPVDRRRVYERDGWVCQLCGKAVVRGSVVPHPMAPTLDHIVPLSAGGEHTYRNVQLAHFRCNWMRRDKGPAQLRLIA